MAIKRVRPGRASDQRYTEMFLDEARLVANLVHPHIVQVYQLFELSGEVLLVMEHVYGVSLLQLLDRLEARQKRLPIDIGCYLIARILNGLYYAHRKCSRDGVHLGIVHRDICPSNILISYRGIPKLTDFGVAKATTSTVDDELETVWGKYPYMPPEAVKRQGTDRRSDLYSIALVMFEMFTNRLVHEAGDTSGLKGILMSETPEHRDVRLYVEGFPDRLAEIILKASDPDPLLRHQSAKELGSAVESFMLEEYLVPDEDRLADYLATVFPEAKQHRWW